MQNYAKSCKSTVIPALLYRNAKAMIEWLCTTFGFEKHAVYEAADGTIAHAELTFGNGMIMIGEAGNETQAAKTQAAKPQAAPFFRQPGEIGGAETQSPCLIVTDCQALYEAAKAAGAKMLIDLEEKNYGGKAFTCADPEGHIWHVGTYDPWGS